MALVYLREVTKGADPSSGRLSGFPLSRSIHAAACSSLERNGELRGATMRAF